MSHIKKCISVEQAFSVAAAHAEMGQKCKLYKQDGVWCVALPSVWE